jgi:hypothetical protein
MLAAPLAAGRDQLWVLSQEKSKKAQRMRLGAKKARYELSGRLAPLSYKSRRLATQYRRKACKQSNIVVRPDDSSLDKSQAPLVHHGLGQLETFSNGC